MSYAGKPYPPPGPIAPPQEATNPLGVVALVLGIMSVFLGCPAAIGALITGWMGMKREPSGMARAGFTIGLIMTIFNQVAGIVGLIFFVFVIGLAGLGAYVDSQERATASYSSFPSADASADPFDSSYGSPDIAPLPVSMPQPMEMPKLPDPYVPPPYVPPTMPPGIDPATFPQPPNFGAPPGFGPPGAMPPGAFPPGAFPAGAFPPGLGPPTTMETLSPASDGDEADLAP
jgi:hypothetical protein